MPRHTDEQQKVEQNEPAKVEALLQKIRTFLSGKSVSLDSGWPVVTVEDMKEFTNLVQGMAELRFGEDCDSELPVQFRMVDKTRAQAMHYWPIPHTHDTGMEELVKAMHISEMNLAIAHEDFKRLWKLFEFERDEAKKELSDA